MERELAWVVFSTLIIAKSAGASRALDLPRSRPHRDDSKQIVLPLDAWCRRFDTLRARLPFLDCPIAPGAAVLAGDARSLPPQVGDVDRILTSPPYLTAIDYLRGHKFSLVWMGKRLDALRELRGTMVGTERGLWHLDGLPPALETQLEDEIETSRKRAILRQYLSDLKKMLAEIQRVLRPGGVALVVAGPTIFGSQAADATTVMKQLGENVGLSLVGSVTRDLSSARRSLPPPSWVRRNPLGKRMRQEVIVALRK